MQNSVEIIWDVNQKLRDNYSTGDITNYNISTTRT